MTTYISIVIRFVLCFVTYSFWGACIYASNSSKSINEFVLDSFSGQRGLPSVGLTGVSCTSNGHIWVSSTNGLVRYDGLELAGLGITELSAIQGKAVQGLYEVVDKSYWISVVGEGIYHFKEGRLTLYNQDNGLAGLDVSHVADMGDKGLWFSTDQGISVYDGKSWSHLGVQQGLPAVPIIEVRKIASTIWVATAMGLYYSEDGQYFDVYERYELSVGRIHSLSLADEGNFFVCTENEGLFKLSFKGELLRKYSSVDGLIGSDVRQGIREEIGVYWFLTDQGLFRMTGDRFEMYTRKKLTRLRNLVWDYEGGLWFISEDTGLYRLRPSKFSYYTEEQGLPANKVNEVVSIGEQLLVATDGGLLLSSSKPFKPQSIFLEDKVVNAVLSDRKDGFWALVDHKHLYHYDADFNLIELIESVGGGLFSKINDLFIGRDDHLYFASDKGLFLYDGESYTRLFSNVRAEVLSFQETSDGQLWFSVLGSGVYRFDGKKLDHFSMKDGLASNVIYSIREGGVDDLWLSHSMGLSHFDGHSFVNITQFNGASAGPVYFSVEDRNRDIWLGTNRGLFSAHKSSILRSFENQNGDLNLRYFDDFDGLLNSEVTSFTQPTFDDYGNIWVGFHGGLSLIDSNFTFSGAGVSLVHIDNIHLDGKSHGVLGDSAIEIPADVRRITIYFHALSYVSSEKVKYKVKLDGYDEDWIYLDSVREYSYTNLRPGKYSFHVIASNGNNAWNSVGDVLHLSFEPYFYQTFIFYVFIFACILLLFWLFFQMRLKRMRASHRSLELLVDERTEKLQRAIDEAKAANAAKSDFLAIMSHEVRTPMNGVIGMSRILLGTKLDSTQKHLALLVRNSAESLMTILNDILDFSKIESDKMTLESIEFNFNALVNEVFELLRHSADDKGLKVHYEIDSRVPSVLLGDPVRIKQVIVNLLSNGIKFTSVGEVSLKARLLGETDKGVLLQLVVKDTGIGVSAVEKKRLFNAFEQADISTTRKYGGSGLGLSICKRLISMMDGDIRVESELGRGSQFICKFNLKKPFLSFLDKSTTKASSVIEKGYELRVLIVEDSLVNQEVAGYELEKLGHTYDVAETGLEALEALKEKAFDVVLMDVNMPHMDGVEATEKIRELEDIIDPGIYIIAVTASAMIGDREKFIDAGMDDYVSKPVEPIELSAALMRATKYQLSRRRELKLQDKKIDVEDTLILEEEELLPDSLPVSLFKSALEELPRRRNLLLAAVSRRMGDEALIEAHTLGSGVAIFRAKKLQSDYQKIESFIKNEDWEAVDSGLIDVEEKYLAFEKRIRAYIHSNQ